MRKGEIKTKMVQEDGEQRGKNKRGGEGGRGETGQQDKDLKRRRDAEAHSLVN